MHGSREETRGQRESRGAHGLQWWSRGLSLAGGLGVKIFILFSFTLVLTRKILSFH